MNLFADIIKIALGSGLFLLLCAIPEWMAEHASWMIWVLLAIFAIAFILYLLRWGHKSMEEGEDNALL